MKNLLLPLFLLPFLVSAQSQFWQHRLKVDVSAAGSQDQTFIYFSDQATDNFDPVWDSYKTPSAAGQPTLYTRIAGNTGILSINALSVDYLGNPITLGLQPGADGTFTLIFQYINEMPLGSVLYLHDMQDDVWQNLMTDSTYTFTMLQTDSNDRFQIFTSPSPRAYGVDDLCSSDAGFVVDLPSILIDGQTTSWDYLLSNSWGVEVASGSTTGLDTIEVSSTDEYTIVVSFDGITSTFTDSVTIGAPVSVTLPADITSNAGESVNVTPNVSTTGGTYSWLLDGTEVGTDATLDYTFLTEGTYNLVLNYVSDDGCEVSQAMMITILGTNSLEDFLLRHSLEYLTIQNDVLYIGMNELENVSEVILMDAKGQVIYSMSPRLMNTAMDLSGYAHGVYYLGVVSNRGSEFVPIQF
ncbi:MAG TPA: hypothetical protein DEO99_06365 [Bacteroidetes bacterium]|nr:hypothetical protein [Bacteroidota bacterium]